MNKERFVMIRTEEMSDDEFENFMSAIERTQKPLIKDWEECFEEYWGV